MAPLTGDASIFALYAPRPAVTRIRRLLLEGRDEGAVAAEMPRHWRRLADGGPLAGRVAERRASPDGSTKLSIRLADGNVVETVVLPSPRGVSVCLSSQVGCPVGCRFCASGMDGLIRNLEPHEIVEQLVHARRVDPRVDRLVVMGIGEPLLNAERLFAALELIRTEGGIGPRRMIVSTVGAKGAIRRLGGWGKRVSLALSLHAPDDELRGVLIPSMAGASVRELVDDATWYAGLIRNKVLAETTLLAGVNDSDDHARRTGELLRGRPIYLNVIPYNPVDGAPFEAPDPSRSRRFVDLVRESGAFATVRKTMGASGVAACGQLRIRGSIPGLSAPRTDGGRAGADS